MALLDCHTHNPERWRDAIVSCRPGEFARLSADYPDAVFSVGVHPWDTATCDAAGLERSLQMLQAIATDPRVVAIGEAGLDSLRGASDDVQEAVLRRQIELSEVVGKPLVIHCVRRYDRMLHLQREMRPQQPWIWHGFRGKPELARQILAASPRNYISLGERFNPLAAATMPTDRLLAETDESPLLITQIITSIASSRPDAVPALTHHLAANLHVIIKPGGCPAEG